MSSVSRRDLALGATIALGTLLLYAFTFQTRYYGDGPGLATMHVLARQDAYYNVLYLPVCRVVQTALGFLGASDPFLALRAVSVLPAGLGLGLAFLFLRAAGAECFGAFVAVLALAVSPSLWFFATTVEVHALNFATVAGVAALTLLAPWARPALALGLVVAAFPLLHLAHQTAFTLGPGWVFLVQFARGRTGGKYSLPGLLLGVGGLLLVALLLSALFALRVRSGSFAALGADVLSGLGLKEPHGAVACSVWSQEWILPLGVLLPLAIVGWLWLPPAPAAVASGGLVPAVGLLVLVPAAFFLWWGVCERGGYFLGSAPFLLIPVAFLLGRASRAKVGAALVLLALQAFFARQRIEAWDTGFDPLERVAQVRSAIGESGLVITVGRFAPDIRCHLPGVEELLLQNLVRRLASGEDGRASPEEVLLPVEPYLDRLLEHWGNVCLELGPPGGPARVGVVRTDLEPEVDAIAGYLRQVYEVRELPHPDWPLTVLVRRR